MPWEAPNFREIFRQRTLRFASLANDPKAVAALRVYYRTHIAQFIEDWGITFNPQQSGSDIPSLMPFVLWPKQREWVNWTYQNWIDKQDGITVKSRDVGISWLSMAFSVSLCVLYDRIDVGVGSQKDDKVDSGGDPSTLFGKARLYVRNLPFFFNGGCNVDIHAPNKKMLFPSTLSSIIGDIGDDIGRGARKSIFFVDEAAHLEHPKLVDAALTATTNCRQDVSSVNGMANSFAERYHSGQVRTFLFHWRDDPRKDDAWYEDLKRRRDAITIRQEYEADFRASVDGIIIDPVWVQASIDAHLKLGIEPTGIKFGALDVADLGKDRNAFAARHGFFVTDAQSWSGNQSDTFKTCERAFRLCDDQGLEGFYYDSDGIGGPMRGDANQIAERREANRMPARDAVAYRGSAAVFDPERKVPGTDVKAKDRFQNLKAQSWGTLADRFRNTYQAVNGGEYDPEMLISLSSGIKELSRLCMELSQPQWKTSGTGKLLVDKTPDNLKSPDLGDAVCMLFHPRRGDIVIDESVFNYFDEPWRNVG